MLRDKAPELYDLWLKIAQEKAATINYVQRAPYEVPERLAQSGRPRALSAMILVLAFCGYLASLGGPGPYIGGLIAILDLLVMLALFFGLAARPPDRLRPPAQAPVNPANVLSPPGAGRARGAQRLPPGLSPAGPPDQQLRLVCGLASTGLVSVPPYRAMSGVPYCASPPKSLTVRPGMTLPKFHTQPSWWLRPSDQKA